MRRFHVGLGITLFILYALLMANLFELLPRLQIARYVVGSGRWGGLALLMQLPLIAAALFIFGPLIDESHLPRQLSWLANPELVPDLYYVLGYFILLFAVLGFIAFL